MCQSSVYTVGQAQEELLLEEVALVEVEGDQVILRSLFGEPISLPARIMKIDLMKHRIILERCDSNGDS